MASNTSHPLWTLLKLTVFLYFVAIIVRALFRSFVILTVGLVVWLMTWLCTGWRRRRAEWHLEWLTEWFVCGWTLQKMRPVPRPKSFMW